MAHNLGKFVIVGVQRTGSTMIARLAASHRHIACGWEWTQRMPPWRVIPVGKAALNANFGGIDQRSRGHIEAQMDGAEWLGYKRLFRGSAKWVGHPSLAPTLRYEAFRRHIRWFRESADIRILHIRRDNNLSWLRSKYVADLSKLYHAGEQYPKDMTLSIPPREALSRVRLKAWIDDQFAELGCSNRYLPIKFEDMISDPEKTYDEISRFLGVDPQPFESSVLGAPQSRGISVADQITNAAELQELLSEQGLLSV